LSIFEIVVTSVWESPHDLLFVAVQVGPGSETAFAAPWTIFVSVHVTIPSYQRCLFTVAPVSCNLDLVAPEATARSQDSIQIPDDVKEE